MVCGVCMGVYGVGVANALTNGKVVFACFKDSHQDLLSTLSSPDNRHVKRFSSEIWGHTKLESYHLVMKLCKQSRSAMK